ncbi:hypothetical protein C1J03_17155 [Sulfitobacter sp. SK012]|nr:hypothetical protein C1J03_17155 [Sulfitobacter sp. SK012]
MWIDRTGASPITSVLHRGEGRRSIWFQAIGLRPKGGSIVRSRSSVFPYLDEIDLTPDARAFVWVLDSCLWVLDNWLAGRFILANWLAILREDDRR